MEVMVFGAGYVGLVQAAGLASTGNQVYNVDVSTEKIQMLRAGKIPFFEPGLEQLVEKGQSKGYLKFVHPSDPNFQELKKRAEIYFLGVQTPEGPDGVPILDYLLKAAEMIADTPDDLATKFVVTKSTVPVGTGDKIEKLLRDRGKKAIVVSNPEFLKQGSAVSDFLKPERVVIGAEDPVAFEVLGFLHKPFMMKRERIVHMSRRSAELVKYAANSFLATKISFINQIAQLAEHFGCDVQEIREGMITDSRIGDQFLFPGIGYGGSCFPKDTHALIAQAHAAKINVPILDAVDAVNRDQRLWPIRKLESELGSKIKGATIGIWGLSFKPNTDDLREAPSIPVIEKICAMGARVRAHDPAAMDRAKVEMAELIRTEKVTLVKDPYAAAERADALLILTEWQEYRTPSFKRLKEIMATPRIIDGRNIYDRKMLKRDGFRYLGVGVPAA